MPVILETLEQVEVLQAGQSGRLTVCGLRCRDPGGLDYLTLDEALGTGEFEVTEIDEGGSVPTLRVRNRLGRMVFLMAGEELIGALQNRVLNASLMIPADRETGIHVSCVEQGRWSYRSPKFRSGGSSSPSFLRASMCDMSSDSYLAAGVPLADQGKVWDMVDSSLDAMGSMSDSSALHQIYEDHGDTLDSYASKLKCPADCCGAAFMIGDRVAGVDLFDKPQTLAKLWPKILRSYAVEALTWHRFNSGSDAITREAEGEQAKPPPTTVREFLRTACDAEEKQFDSPGIGKDVRFSGAGVVAAGLVVEDQPVHIEMFPKTTS